MGCLQLSHGTQSSAYLLLHLVRSPCCWLTLQWHMSVGVNLGASGYLKDITAATSDIRVQVIFCNAGYMCTGFFERRCAGRQRPLSCGCRPMLPPQAKSGLMAANTEPSKPTPGELSEPAARLWRWLRESTCVSECTVLLAVYMELSAAQAARYAKGHGVLVCHLLSAIHF